MSDLEPGHFEGLTMDEWQEAVGVIRRIAERLHAQNKRELLAAADVLTPSLPRLPRCTHEDTVMQQTGDGTPVEFCPGCGRNIWIGRVSMADELPA